MPGVYARLAMTTGVYHQQLKLKGNGYTMVGLVMSDQEKDALNVAGNDFTALPHMTMACGSESVCIHVDTNRRVAKIYWTTESGTTCEEEFRALPAIVWVACAMKRYTVCEAVLMPCYDWSG